MASSHVANNYDTDNFIHASNHKIAYVTANLKRTLSFKWVTYSYRCYNKESADLLGSWVIAHDWRCVLHASDRNSKANANQGEINDTIEHFFPLQTTKKKSCDLP